MTRIGKKKMLKNDWKKRYDIENQDESKVKQWKETNATIINLINR